MIEISVSAIKGGFRELFKTSDKAPQGIASIFRPDSASPYAVGKEAYAISFMNTGLVCTKCKIIRDILGGSRVGNIAFSILVPFNEKLSGKLIIELLDGLLREYSKYINEENGIGDVHENWDFVWESQKKYKTGEIQGIDDMKIFRSGAKDAAYIYYPYNYVDKKTQKVTSFDLEDIFENPYQKDYSEFKQVFFVSKEYKEDSDRSPLRALRHSSESNLTGKIDLNKKIYTLKGFTGRGEDGVKIEIRVEGRDCNEGDKITNYDDVSISYFKSKFYETKNKTGRLDDKEIRDIYLFVDDERKEIRVKDVKLEAYKQPFEIKLYDKRRERGITNFDDYKIYAENETTRKRLKPFGNTITFEGDDIDKSWKIIANANNGELTGQMPINPEKCKEKFITVDMYKEIRVKIEVFDEEDKAKKIPDFKVNIVDGNGYIKRELVFTGDKINRTYNISVQAESYRRSRDISFNPATDGKLITFYLQKKTEPRKKHISDDAEIKCPISKKQKLGKIVKNPYVWAIGAIAVISLIVFIWIYPFWESSSPNGQVVETCYINKDAIQKYIEGDSLLFNTLQDYKTKIEPSPSIKIIGERVWYNPLTWFSKPTKDSTEYNKWQATSDLLDSAIQLRTLIDNKEFCNSIVKHYNYSIEQETFKTIIRDIDDDQCVSVKEKIGDVFNLTLTQIADSIQKIKNLDKTTQGKTETADQKSNESTTEPNNEKQNSAQIYQTDFENKFWDLVQGQTSTPNKAEYDKWFASGNKISSKNDYKKFYDTYLKDNNKFEKFKKIPAIKRRKASRLSELEELINKQ